MVGAWSTDFQSFQMKAFYANKANEISSRPQVSSVMRADGGGEREAEGSPLVVSCIDGINNKQ